MSDQRSDNVLLLQGACLYILIALVLAWCLVAMKLEIGLVTAVFSDFKQVLQAHIDFLLMSALLFGFYAARTPLPAYVRWPMVIGAFTNPSVFILRSMSGISPTSAEDTGSVLLNAYSAISISLTTFGFGMAALLVLRATLRK